MLISFGSFSFRCRGAGRSFKEAASSWRRPAESLLHAPLTNRVRCPRHREVRLWRVVSKMETAQMSWTERRKCSFEVMPDGEGRPDRIYVTLGGDESSLLKLNKSDAFSSG
jgi:hypothetical protein